MCRPTFVSALPLSVMLMAPAVAPAQDAVGGDWSRIIRTRRCPVAQPCVAREGLVWDSTNAWPTYLPVLVAAGVGGDVILSFRVGADGAVDPNSVAVVRASNPALSAPSIHAVRRWRFDAESPSRPSTAVPVQAHVLFAHAGACTASSPARWIGWAGANQVVIGACATSIPRSELNGPAAIGTRIPS